MQRKWRLIIALVTLLTIAGSWIMLDRCFSGQPEIGAAPEGDISWVAQDTGDNGKIVMRVGTVREYGYRIGDVVPVEVVIVASKVVRIDVGSIALAAASSSGPYGYGAPSNPDFEFVSAPEVSSFDSDGKHVWIIRAQVRSWLVNDTVEFGLNFNYTDNTDNGTWYQVSTPTIDFGTTRSAQKDDKFDTGDTSPRVAPAPPGANLLRWFGGLLIFSVLAAGILLWKPRWLVDRGLTAGEKAWRVFDAVREDAEKKRGWNDAHYLAIATAVRRYLGIEALTVEQVSSSGIADSELAAKILRKLQDPLYRREAELYGFERTDLYADLGKLVPRK